MLSVSSQRKYNFYHQNTFLDAFRTNSRNIIGRNPSMVIPLLPNQDLTPMLVRIWNSLDEIEAVVRFCSGHEAEFSNCSPLSHLNAEIFTNM